MLSPPPLKSVDEIGFSIIKDRGNSPTKSSENNRYIFSLAADLQYLYDINQGLYSVITFVILLPGYVSSISDVWHVSFVVRDIHSL